MSGTDQTPVPQAVDPSLDPEATANGFIFGEDPSALAGRQVLAKEELIARLTALISSCPGCDNVRVIDVYRIWPEDRKDGCNWSFAIMLDPAGVAPEVYSLGYAAVISTARAGWNLKD